MRFLISDNKINPIAWEVSKIEDTLPPGIIQITITQDLFDPEKDNKELMIADYYKSKIIPQDSESTEFKKEEYKITYSISPTLKVGGSYKTFSIHPKVFDQPTRWEVENFDSQNYTEIFDPENPNVLKLKVSKDYSLIGQTFKLNLYIDEKLEDQIDVEVIGL